ncbi:MAG TPA: UDP binding domain-containing protein, partial [Acidobacteriaceae bacterium]|nr:UDP binding domain-containing protein [Acidobacteriaceae bacterium]
HCIPIDPFYLSWKAKEFDFRTKFIELAGEVNLAMPYFVVESVMEAMSQQGKALRDSRILILGMAYKRDIDDLRESPSLTIIELLQKRGAQVSYNDPFFPTVGHGRKYALNMTSTPLEKVGEFDCVVIVTDHSQYDYADIVSKAKLVVDTRNATRGIEAKNLVRC